MDISILESKIHTIRGEKVMLDFDLATLYEVENRVLKQSVRRNKLRFPLDFMFQLDKIEWQELITNSDKLPESIKYALTSCKWTY
ncbi:MAG: ORF6N domain-containing protein [Bacteroidia bacterium]